MSASNTIKVYASSYARFNGRKVKSSAYPIQSKSSLSNTVEYDYQYNYINGKQKSKGHIKIKGKIIMTINDTFFDVKGNIYYAITVFNHDKPNPDVNLSVNLPTIKKGSSGIYKPYS